MYHFFGINNPYPEDMSVLYSWHPYMTHAISKDPIKDGFERVGFAIDDLDGEAYVGAPYILWREHIQKYMMIFESKIEGKRTLEYAYSEDLYHFERTYEPAFTNLGYTRRDPCILQIEDEYIVYICNPSPEGSAVSITVTKDFEDISQTKNCFQILDGLAGSSCESPFVVERNGLYYLFFTYAHHQYNETRVYVSDRYDQFRNENQITTLYAHAGEIFTCNGKEYMTNCGPEDDHFLNEHGLYASELCWVRDEFEVK